MIDTACVIVAVMVIICYHIIKFTTIPILYKNIIRILLSIVGAVVAVYSLIHNDYGYFFGLVTAVYIFESFGTSDDK